MKKIKVVKIDIEFFTSLILIVLSIFGIFKYGFEYYLFVFILLSISIITKSIKLKFVNRDK